MKSRNYSNILNMYKNKFKVFDLLLLYIKVKKYVKSQSSASNFALLHTR